MVNDGIGKERFEVSPSHLTHFLNHTFLEYETLVNIGLEGAYPGHSGDEFKDSQKIVAFWSLCICKFQSCDNAIILTWNY